MARPGQAQDEAMDAILASIRSMMAEGDVRPPPTAARPPSEAPPPANVSRLFAEPPASPFDGREAGEEPDRPAASPDPFGPVEVESGADDPVARHAFADAAAGTRDADTADDFGAAETGEPSLPRYAPAPVPVHPPQERAAMAGLLPDSRPVTPPLMSPQAGAAVSGAFDTLAASVFSGSGRTVDEVVEGLLRPMLRDWLDDNLPPLVERLVRDEIERVSRGRR